MKKTILYTGIISALLLTGCDNDVAKTTANKNTATVAVNKTGNQPSTTNLNELYQQATQALFSQRQLSASVYGLTDAEVGLHYANKMEDYSPANEAKLRQAIRKINKQISQTSPTDAQA